MRTTSRRVMLFTALLLACCERASVTFATQTPPSRQRRALLIGIDDYSASRLKARPEWRPARDRALPSLRGAVNDVGLLREMLIARYGFNEAGIVTLENQQATREAILAAIEKHLVAPAARGDVLLFYYAGHGSQVENSSSSELDGRDESIVPADSRLGAPDVRDKQLAALFNRVLDKEARLTLIFDSCHSGSAARALDPDASVRAVLPDARDVRDPSEPAEPESRGALVLSASKDFARAFEREDEQGRPHGVFSWALLNAMRNAAGGEAAADTFLRAQAMMRADAPYQDPVMSGDATARLTPLLSAGRTRATETAIALERVLDDGTMILQGGWAHGLTVGTELRVRQAGDAAARIRIIEMLGVTRSRGRLEMRSTRSAAPRATLVPGTLLDLTSWAAPPGKPLRVWMPQAQDAEAARALALELREGAAAAGVRWIADPAQATPTHVLRWRDGGWELRTSRGDSRRFSPTQTAASILAEVTGRDPSLFVQLPAPPALIGELGVGPGTDCDNIEPLQQPAGAHYVLAGRLVGDRVEYAWVRPGVLREDESHTPLPARTDWTASDPPRDAAIVMRHTVLRLYKILAWHQLEAPRDFPSPYRLRLRDSSGAGVDDAKVAGGRKYQLVLQAVDTTARRIQPRYYYVFGIDAFGRSVLLFPRRGSVENRFPIDPDAPPPREIGLSQVSVTAPYGQDTYVLISTDESLPNPSVLEWAGVRTRGPRGATTLEELLSRTGSATRAPDPVDTSPIWSVDRLLIQSTPPDEGVSQ